MLAQTGDPAMTCAAEVQQGCTRAGYTPARYMASGQSNTRSGTGRAGGEAGTSFAVPAQLVPFTWSIMRLFLNLGPNLGLTSV